MAAIPEQGSIHNAKAANAGAQFADNPRIDASKLASAADGAREKLVGQVKRRKAEEDEFQNTNDDTGVTTEDVAATGQDAPMLLAQAETASSTSGGGAAGAGTASGGTASAGAASGGAAGAEAAAGLALSDATLGTIILAGTVGVAAAASGGGAAAAAVATPAVGFVLAGVIALGQVNNNTGLVIEAFKADGTALLVDPLTTVVNANGTFTITVTEDYTGPVLIRLVDTNPAANYTNEGTGAAADIATDLRVVVNVAGSGGANITVAITPLTELAVRELLGDGGGDAGTSGTNLANATTTQVTAANDSVKTAFGLTGDIVTTAPVTVDNAGFGAATAVQQAYGHALAAVAGMEVGLAQSTGTVLNTLSQNLAAGALGQVAVDQLLAGAAVADAVGTNAGGTTAALTAVIATNISAIGISADTGTAGDFITQTAAQTISATLDVALAGTKLWGSLDNGATWTDISGSVVGTALTWAGVTLAAGDNVVKLAVTANTVAAFTGAAADLVAGTKISMQTVALDNTAPTFAVSVPAFAENLTGVAYTPTVTDAHLVTYTLGGVDAASFTIDPNSGKVSFINSPNFEAPTDLAGAGSVAGDNFYDITVTATDGAGNATANPVRIEVTNVNEAPTLTSGAAANFLENGTGTVYTATATDPDTTLAFNTLTYALAGTDAALFNINATTGAVTFAAAPNFEAPADAGANNVYDITVTASDGTNTTAAQAVAITVTNVNEAPTLTSAATANFAENATGTVYTATATDPDAGAVLTYALAGADAALFNINATTGAVTFAAAPNFEAPRSNVYDITVTASDGTNTTAAQAVAITVTNVNEAPTVVTQNAPATMTLAVNQAITANNDVSMMFTDVDANTVWTYSATGLPAGVTLNPTTGLITGTPTTTVTAAPVVITASDGAVGGALTVSHTIAVSVVTAPVISGIATVTTQATSGNALTFTATVSEAVTVTGTPTLTLDVGGTAMTATYTGGTGTNTLTFTAAAPATGTDSTVTVTAITLGGGATVIGNTTGQPLMTGTVGQVVPSFVVDNTAPTFTSLTTANAAENQTVAYTSAVTDATPLTYTLTGGLDMGLFTINANTGVVSFNNAPNFEAPTDNGANGVYNVTVTATDALGHATNQNVAITLTNVNETPTVNNGVPTTNAFVVNQAITTNNNVTGLFTDPDVALSGDALTYTATGLPAGITLNPTTGVVSGTPTATTASPVNVVFTAMDIAGLSVSHTMAISVVAAPTITSTIDNVTNFEVTSDIVLTSSENVTAVAGKFITIVNDANDATYAGFHGEATTNTIQIDAASAAVTISGNKITINPGFDLDFSNNYHIMVDAGAFVGVTSGQGSVATVDATVMNFSTVLPSATATATASSAMAAGTDTIVIGHSWWDAEGFGAPGGLPVARDFSTGNLAIAANDLGTAGIATNDFYIAVNSFAAGDLIYVDNGGNNANQRQGNFNAGLVIDLGAAPTAIITGASGTATGNNGGQFDVTVAGSAASFADTMGLQTLLGNVTYQPVLYG